MGWLPKQQSVEMTFHNSSDPIGGLQEQTLEITDESSETDQGLARISAKWMSLNLDNPVLGAGQMCYIFVGLYKAVSVPRSGDGTQYWFTVSCTNSSPSSPKPPCQESVKLKEQVAEEDQTMRKLKQK